MAIVGTRTCARTFLVEKGMRIPIRVTNHAASLTTQLAPAHRKFPFRLTRSWSAIARMKLVDATEC
jgi:hypothetical protein